MNERLQKTALTFSHSITSYLRRAVNSDLKALCVVRDLSEEKRHTFSSCIKICSAGVRYGAPFVQNNFSFYKDKFCPDLTYLPRYNILQQYVTYCSNM